MDLHDAIYQRRSIRSYTARPVADQDIEDILAAGMMAPSASNLQPWYFVVVKSEEKMNELKELMAAAARNLLPYWQNRFAKYPDVVAETEAFVRCLGNAPVCILAFLCKKDYNGQEPCVQSVAAAIENMLLTATDKGLGSCWLTSPLTGGIDQEVHAAFAPDKGSLVALVTLGYTEQKSKAPRRRDGRYCVV